MRSITQVKLVCLVGCISIIAIAMTACATIQTPQPSPTFEVKYVLGQATPVTIIKTPSWLYWKYPVGQPHFEQVPEVRLAAIEDDTTIWYQMSTIPAEAIVVVGTDKIYMNRAASMAMHLSEPPATVDVASDANWFNLFWSDGKNCHRINLEGDLVQAVTYKNRSC